MKILKELETIFIANDRWELDAFHIKLKKCALVGYDFKTCLDIIQASYDFGIDIDSLLDVMMRVGKKALKRMKEL